MLRLLLDLLLPPECWICADPGPTLCLSCREGLSPRAARFFLGVDPEIPVLSAGSYSGARSEALRRLKLGGCSPLAGVLGRQLRALLGEEDWDWLVPIPTHAVRLKGRGVNPSLALARSGFRTSGPRIGQFLERLDDSPSRFLLGAQARRRVEPHFGTRLREQWRGSRVLLLDDVCTTGVTLRKAGGLLLKGGAEKVGALVVAHTPPG